MMTNQYNGGGSTWAETHGSGVNGLTINTFTPDPVAFGRIILPLSNKHNCTVATATSVCPNSENNLSTMAITRFKMQKLIC